MNFRHVAAAFGAVALLAGCGGSQNSVKPAIEKDGSIEAKIEKTLKGMSLEEKAGQLVQINISEIYDSKTKSMKEDKLETVIGQYKVGSILNVDYALPKDEVAAFVKTIQDKSLETMGIPCLYGLDMIHGATYYKEGTFFPQEINLAATFDPQYAAAMGKAIGYETRAGLVPWVFSPVMDLTRTPLWSRNWESFGEDPYLQSVMAEAETRAIQGDDPNAIDKFHCAVSLKHFMAYGAPTTGKDRTPAIVAENDLREKYFAPFKACVEAGALTIMVNSASINGIPTHANYKLLTEWVKEGLNWDGMIVTDWADINNLYTRDHLAVDKKDALRIGINAGIDMVMEPYDATAAGLIVELAKEGLIPMARLDDAVRRVLRVKYRLGLFDAPVWDTDDYDQFGCDEFKTASYNAALESEVLLKNDGVLPLKKGSRILVTGPTADWVRSLNGGWSYTWQGTNDPAYVGEFNSIYEALKNKFGSVTYVPSVEFADGFGDWQKENVGSFAPAVAAARAADVIVACLGENSYCETRGNFDNLEISENQIALVKELAKTGKPVVLVLAEGRARIISKIEPLASAVVDVMLPGNYGADALAELLSGDQNFSGKLPFTYPRHTGSLHTYDFKVSEVVSTMSGMYNYDAVMDVQYPFGSGLSYTKFEYSDLKVDKAEFASGDVLKFTVNVKNVGEVAGKESVLLYSSDLVASLMPDFRRLRAFSKVSLAPGEQTTVELTVPADDLAFVGQDMKWRLEEGDFHIAVGGQSLMIHCTKTKVWETPNK